MEWASGGDEVSEGFLGLRCRVTVQDLVRGGIRELAGGFLEIVMEIEDHCGGPLVGRQDDDVGIGAEGFQGMAFRVGEVGFSVDGVQKFGI